MRTSLSTKNLASTEALASSRRWKIALLRSAIRSKLRSNSSAYLTRGWLGLVSGASSKPLSLNICSRASTPMFTRGTSALSIDKCTSAFLTTNHSLAFHSKLCPYSTKKSKQLFMPTTGCKYSPIESSFRCTSAWNITSPTLVPASHAGSNRFACHIDLARSKVLFGSNENIGSLPSFMRTCNASARYSRFTAAAESVVDVRHAVLDSSAKDRAYMPVGAGAMPSLLTTSMLRGTRSTFQPMLYSMRRVFFKSASFRLRDFSSFSARFNRSWA
mmetsp:Transcript_38177/g.106335  ORF Transcript_38177/g.106335 Transcript_38177/m.106335 type:complete len:273 (-) Transcript_38177:576-1394(-)